MSDLDPDERRVLNHAEAMCGWLSQSGMSRQEKAICLRLEQAGLGRFEDRVLGKTVARFVLTPEGRRAARA